MSNIITRDYNGNVFQFRSDGYFNMTKAAQAFGKKLDNFWRLDGTLSYCQELAQALGLTPSDVRDLTGGLIEPLKGRNGGTWAHPKLAVFFARWLDVKFAVFCDMVIDDILNKKAELTITKPGESMAMKVPQTFSEALRLAAELEEQKETLRLQNEAMKPAATPLYPQ
ncbi:hypothetical protein CFY91_05260 [Pseudomonas fluvialis]|uniref:KilA-N domain-containing protein n=1 Tax=Pseudomonas fluvialis TaxID=1793966 RepID=A0ABQ2ATB6_9PSED|nr:KilA-N domain-containing protein [Pseudomonas fluvialis]OXM41301.1 hypothetical protein CFY91_05260 [Pseudomonas fluvialis]GGH95100.1 hypothetical protein GCM10007363_23580 [Pseudomonas fluvialis]